MQESFALMSFREDRSGKLFAAFRNAPLGAYRFELTAPKALLNRSIIDQERWAQKAVHARGHRYVGLHISDEA